MGDDATTSDGIALPSTVKPGWKSSEFWFNVGAVVVGLLLNSGLFKDSSSGGKMLALAATGLTALGYTVCRTWHKTTS